jgi:hypothetical protein
MKTQTNTNKPLRDAKGKFVSNNTHTPALRRDSKGKFVGNGSTNVKSATIKSSFIQSLKINGNTVEVVMTRNPKITYTYKPTAVGFVTWHFIGSRIQ